MGHQHALLHCHGRKFLEQFDRLTDISADANNAGQPMWISQTDVEGHEAALGETTQQNLVRRKTGHALRLEQLEKQFPAALDARDHITEKVIPGIAAVIL